jgi:hypothetical protein
MAEIQPEIDVNVNIKGVEHLSYIEEPKNTEKLQEFYNSVTDALIKFNNLGEGEKSDPKKGYNTFFDYFRTYLYEEKNTRFKLDPKTNIVVLSKRYYEKEGFTLSFCSKTFNILDFKHCMVKKTDDDTDDDTEEMFKDVISIETFKEGTNIIVVIQDGKIVTVRTSGTFDAETSYDTTETHYELFFKTLDEVNFGLSKFFDISKTKPDIRFCFNFLMKLNFTPFPTFCDNEIHLISAYEINNKTKELDIYNTLCKEFSDSEEKKLELEEYIKTDLTSSYINYFNTKDIISLFYNIGSGLIKGPKVSDISPEIDIKSVITDIIAKQDALQGERGLIIKHSDGRYQELINLKYQYIIDLRGSCSMEITPENERKLFYELFIKLLFTKEKEEERSKLFYDFYQYYDSHARLDGKGGQYSALFKKFHECIVKYSILAFDLYKKHRIQKLLPHERSEIDKDIPICFKYKYTNIVNIIHSLYQSEKEKEHTSSTKKGGFKIELKDVIETIVFGTILKSKYDSYMSDDPQLKYKDIYGDIYGKIMTPL